MSVGRRGSRLALATASIAGLALVLALAVAWLGSGGVSAVATCNTTLAFGASAGADTIMVGDAAGCDTGDEIVLNQGGGTEECQEVEHVAPGTAGDVIYLVGTLAHDHSQGETVVEVAVCPTPTPTETETPPPTETPTPTPTPSPTATPTATAAPTPVAQVLGCPQGGKWSIAVWDAGADGPDTDGAETDGVDTGEALGTCGEGAVDAAYALDPDSQMWRRWFPGHPEISNFERVKHNQGFIAHGSLVAVQHIAFTSSRDGNDEIYVMDPDGTGQTRLTDNPADDYAPAWSPDRSKIAFTSERDGNREIYVMNADGTGQTRLTNNPADDTYPDWSPDGSKMAFTSDREGNDEIYVMNADGTGQINLTNDPADEDSQPTWSPDGSKIAFSWWGANAEIYVMDSDGTDWTRLTYNSVDDTWPAWSPDGSKIAFTSHGWYPFGKSEIFVMNADGTGQTQLTNTVVEGWTTTEWRSAWEPAWSPGGSKIAFTSDLDGDWEIYVMNADGGGRTKLTSRAADDIEPAWAAPTLKLKLPVTLAARQVYNCPQGGKWSIAVADFPDGVDAGEVLATCGEGAVDAAYALDPDSQMWRRWFPGHPEISNFEMVTYKQGFLAHADVSSLLAKPGDRSSPGALVAAARFELATKGL
jgi:Tol biopolymer transport system component